MSNAKTVMSQAANTWAGPTYIEDVFSTYLYTGNGTTQTITNGIDLAGEGGLVWIKNRPDAGYSHYLADTERGIGSILFTNLTNGSTSSTAISAFNSDGFSVSNNTEVNQSGKAIASWTFRKAPRFFDVVTYTGDGTTDGSKKVPHSLGSVPGCIMVKATSTTGNWNVYHRETFSSPETRAVYLNLANSYATGGVWGYTLPTDAEFTVGSASTTNASGVSYVAYLFAHDPLGPSGDGSDGLIACGSYTGNASTDGPEIDLGWEPQWLLVKSSTRTGTPWLIFDAMRGWNTSTSDYFLRPNTSDNEFDYNVYSGGDDFGELNASGFKVRSTGLAVNGSGHTYIYIAIRRGPMRQPESGTEVFAVNTADGVEPRFDSGFPVDFALRRQTSAGASWQVCDRMRGQKQLLTNYTDSETAQTSAEFDYMDGWFSLASVSSTDYSWMLKRAPGFFDVVAYTGDVPTNQVVKHNLTVAPEMMWVKSRSVSNWYVYHASLGATKYLQLNGTAAAATASQAWGDTAPTETDFTAGSFVNGNNDKFIAYLFASLPGVSKLGSYVGNSINGRVIDCGFTSGARFVLIKKSSASGDWYLFDSLRGIISGNDPYLLLNSTSGQGTFDYIDPNSSGFALTEASLNTSGVSYIFYAIA